MDASDASFGVTPRSRAGHGSITRLRHIVAAMIVLDTVTVDIPRELVAARLAPPYIDRMVERDAAAQMHDVLFAIAMLALAALVAFAIAG